MKSLAHLFYILWDLQLIVLYDETGMLGKSYGTHLENKCDRMYHLDRQSIFQLLNIRNRESLLLEILISKTSYLGADRIKSRSPNMHGSY